MALRRVYISLEIDLNNAQENIIMMLIVASASCVVRSAREQNLKYWKTKALHSCVCLFASLM